MRIIQHRSRTTKGLKCRAATDPLLLRAARGEETLGTPVWLMRQAGRYMADFRKFSDVYGFRQRSETASMAIELSLQPWKAFQTDGVIMFSDILTPLPALGIEFDVIKGKGPVIETPIVSDMQVSGLRNLDDPSHSLPFIEEILGTLKQEIGTNATLLGFIGTPWTLAAYSVEGAADKNCMKTKKMMLRDPQLLHKLLDKLTVALCTYVSYQISSGAQVIQLFDSWAHHLSPAQFTEFSVPYCNRIVRHVRENHPEIPTIYHANGGTGKLAQISNIASDVTSLDWGTQMSDARQHFGSDRVLQGNVDPMILMADEEIIRKEVQQCMQEAGAKHILNLGHGVMQQTPEENVGIFCQACRN